MDDKKANKNRGDNELDVELDEREHDAVAPSSRIAPGKMTVASTLPPVSRKQNLGVPVSADSAAATAEQGITGAGGPIPFKGEMESRFGARFDDVRAHTDANASEAAGELDAQAYAVGSDIAFSSGSPSRELVAHELAHVVQARGGVHKKQLSEAGDDSEREADAVAADVARGASVTDFTARHQGGQRVPRSSGFGTANTSTVFFKKNLESDSKAKAGLTGAKAADAEEAKKANEAAKEVKEFKKKKFILKNHHPSTARGAFDFSYVPAAGAINITVRTDFKFKDSAKATWGKNVLGRVINQMVWQFQYMSAIRARWSGKYSMKCVKKHWESLVANTKINVVRDTSNPHYKLTIVKMPAGKHHPGSAISRWRGSGVPNAPGKHPKKWVGTLGGELGSTDATELEQGVDSAAAAKTAVARMRAHNPGTVLFANNSSELLRSDKEALHNLGTMLAMTNHPKLKINVVGHASTSGRKGHNKDLGLRRAQAVEAEMRGAGTITHSIGAASKGEQGAAGGSEWRKATIKIPDLPKTFRNDYDVAGHEFGHMLGLHEEYKGAGKAAHYKLVEEAFGKKVAKTFTAREAENSSVMASGLDVRPHHYVTVWEALGTATAPTLTRDDWKIVY